MNQKAIAWKGIVILCSIVIITSLCVILLIKFNIIKVRGQQTDLLDTQFIPLPVQETLQINSFQFCAYLSENNTCIAPGPYYNLDEPISYQIQLSQAITPLLEAIVITSPMQEIVINIEQREAIISDKGASFFIQDTLSLSSNLDPGQYHFSLTLGSPKDNQEKQLTSSFILENPKKYIFAEEENS